MVSRKKPSSSISPYTFAFILFLFSLLLISLFFFLNPSSIKGISQKETSSSKHGSSSKKPHTVSFPNNRGHSRRYPTKTGPPVKAPTTISPDSFEMNPLSSDLMPTNLSSLPSQIFVTDGDIEYLPVILNCVGSLLSLGVPTEEIYVLTYEAEITRTLTQLGVHTLYRPDWLAEGAALVRKFRCPILNGKKQIDLVMYMKRRMFLELALRAVKFMIFDSDVVFHSNPQKLMEADKQPSIYGEDVDMVVYGSASVAIGSVVGWSDFGNGKFGMNGSPGAYLNSELLVPWFKALFEHGIAIWEQCRWGWGQIGDNEVFYELGLRWRMIKDEEGKLNNHTFRSEWVGPLWDGNANNLPKGRRSVGRSLEKKLFDELVLKGKTRNPNIVASETDSPFIPAHHFHAPGGPAMKELTMKDANAWFVKDDWKLLLKEKVEVSIWDLLTFHKGAVDLKPSVPLS